MKRDRVKPMSMYQAKIASGTHRLPSRKVSAIPRATGTHSSRRMPTLWGRRPTAISRLFLMMVPKLIL